MSAEQASLIKKIVFSGTITALTGLHIGGSEVGLQIGGADKVVVHNPSDNTPYVPGSSLKGRMRSLLERVHC
ncbi:MAG TPA: RAMP superfamily CRISPR-associated protein, partial [Roseiarcus sp.]|nr:RAMP superfamily CRISPR-associated protein [Roseiarcus sp.]